MRHVREAVRFADGVAAAEAAGVTRWLELGPAGVLCGMAARSVGEDAVLVPALRADRPEAEAFATLLATAHIAGVTVDWRTLLAGTQLLALPTYAFQHRSYWLDPQRNDQPGTGHPILTAARAADRRGRVAVHGPLLARDARLGRRPPRRRHRRRAERDADRPAAARRRRTSAATWSRS